MRILRRLLFICLTITSIYYIFMESESTNNLLKETVNSKLHQSELSLQFKTIDDDDEKMDHSHFFKWIDQSSSDLLQEFGEPNRKDLSPYGYTWWVYANQDTYLQFGIDGDQKIETIYARGVDIPLKDLNNKESYDQMNHLLKFNKEVKYQSNLSSYTFYLTDEDLLQRPLVHIDEDIFIQFYFDQFTNDLSSFRLLKIDTLLKHIPYEIQYRGKLPDKPSLTDQQWKEIERGMEQQIFELTNFIREEHDLDAVQWRDDLHEVAFLHSKDMVENNYFSHYGLEGKGLKERLETKEIVYQFAGENIAADYPDGLAAVEGWLNSKGHREALLDEKYTHLGVGVHRLYYTQNFISSRE